MDRAAPDGRGSPGRRAAAAAVLALALAGCDSGAMEPTGAAGRGEGQLIAMGGGPHGPSSACFECHGLRGQGDGAGTPRLAALDRGYLEKQLHDYAQGLRRDPTMEPIARGLTTEDRRAVAAYYARLPLPTQGPGRSGAQELLGRALYLRGDPARGLPSCRSCHGEPFAGGGPGFPALGGQPRAYTATQLQRWKKGYRQNDPRDVMVQVVRRLSAEEIAALGAYLETVTPS